jgi:hypothetical protein
MSNDGTFKGCKVKLVERKIDVCKLTASISSNLIVSTILNIIKDSSTSNMTCPMQPNTWGINDFKLTSPLPFPPGTKFCAKIMTFAKTSLSKNFQSVMIIRVNATYY